jgi:hypothetical protein
MKKLVTPEAYMNAALEHVESKGIREYAKTAHNWPIWCEIAKGAIAKGTEPKHFATYIVIVAMGM